MNKKYKNLKSAITSVLFLLMVCGSAMAQLVGPANGGNFDLGADFTANNWLVLNGPTANVNAWVVGTQPTGFTGNSAYITTNALGVPPPFGYSTSTTTSSTIYRDVTFPAGATSINLSFKWLCQGETGLWDQMTVYLVSSTMTPTTATPVNNSNTISWGAGTAYTVGSFVAAGTVQNFSASIPASIVGNCASPVTMKLCFNFRCDNGGGTSPGAALDDVLLTAATPTLTTAGGTFTINNTLPTSGSNYNSLNEAINDLNAVAGCGSFTNPLIFNVSAGQVFNENPNPILGSGTLANQVTFQKSGVGANPKITPSAGLGIYLWGADYINFDGIDVDASAATLAGFGVFLRNLNATNGCQNNTFKNFNVKMNQNLTGTYGILSSSSTTIGAGTTPTVAAGANSNNSYMNFTAENTYNGVRIICGTTTVANQDINNTVGVSGAGCQTTRNTIRNLGGNTTNPIVVSTLNQSNLKIYNTDIYNASHTTTFSTIIGLDALGCTGNSEVYNNKVYNVTTTNAGAATIVGMSFSQGTGTGSTTSNLRVYNNSISGLNLGYTGTASTTLMIVGMRFPSVTSSLATHTINVDNNSISLGSGTNILANNTCFQSAGTSATTNGLLNVKNNIFANYTAAQTTSKHYCYFTSGTTTIGAAGSAASYNDCYLANTTNGFVGLTSATDRATVAAFNTAIAGFATTNLSADPIFSNQNNDLHAYGTGVNNVAGATLSAWVTTDMDCTTRSTPLDLGADDFTPITDDLSVSGILSPVNAAVTVGGNPTQTISVTVANLGTTPVDLSLNPVTVTVTVGGVGSGVFTGTLSTGVFNQGQTFNVPMSSTYTMTTNGTHTFAAVITASVPGDANATNNSANFTHQVRSSYGIVKSNAAYSSIMSTGTTYTNILAPSFSVDDEGVTEVISLAGTTFNYFGQPVTGFRATANGLLTFNTAFFATSFTINYGASANNLSLSPFWSDLAMLGSNAANKDACMRYKINGTLGSGTAEIIIEWANMEGYTFSPPNLNFQIKLKEAGNVIEYNYGVMQRFDGSANGPSSVGIAQAGMSGATAASNTLADRIIQQRVNENFWGSATTPVGLYLNPTCDTRYTFTYGGAPNTVDPGAPTAPANDAVDIINVSTVAQNVSVNATPCLNTCGNIYRTSSATATTGITACAPVQGTPDDDVWFKFSMGATDEYKIQVNPTNNFDAVIQLFDASLTQIGTCTNSAGAGLTEIMQTPTLNSFTGPFYIRVYHAGVGTATTGEFSICVSEFVAPPANDECIGAITLAAGATCTPTTEPVNILGATASATIPVCTDFTPGNADDDVWYKFTTSAAAGLTYTITLQSNVGYNGVLQLFSGACGSLVSVDCKNTTGTAGVETIVSSALATSTTYFVRVYHSGTGGATGDYSICVTRADAGAPTATVPTITPTGNLCAAAARNITLNLVDFTGVASANIVWSKNGVAQTNIPMSLQSGTANNGVWAATIPVQADQDAISYSYSFVDAVTPTANSGTLAGGSYIDGGPAINAGTDVTVNTGSTFNLSATHSLQGGCLRITEFVLFKTGTGANVTYPAYAVGDDMVEITNTSGSSINLAGFKLKAEGSRAVDYTFPAYTVASGGTVVVNFGTGTNDLVNGAFFTATDAGDSWSSGTNQGVWLTTASGAIVDAIAINTWTFSGASGVTVSNYSGSGISSPSGAAGARLTGADANSNANWVAATAIAPLNIGTVNAGIPLTCSTVAATWTGGNLSGSTIADQVTTPVFAAPGIFTFTASITDAAPCTSTDNIVVTAVAPTAVTANFTVNTTSGTSGGSVTTHIFTNTSSGGIADTYAWSFSPNNVAYLPGFSASSENPQVQFTLPGVYTVTMVATNGAGSDSEIKTNYITIVAAYCTPQFTQTFSPPQGCGDGDQINSVSISYGATTIMNNANTGCNGNPFAYINYAPVAGVTTCNLALGGSYTVTATNAPNSFSEGYAVWLDANNDGDFADAGEFLGGAAPAITSTFTINLPYVGVSTGLKRMRVIAAFSTTLTAANYCITGTYGETEDYTINLTPPLPPQNDACANATNLTVNGNLACGTTTSGTLLAATSVNTASVCTFTPNHDVWFKFVALANNHEINVTPFAGQTIVTQFYAASCAGSVLGCTSTYPYTLATTVGTTYYIRAFDASGLALVPPASNFTVCVGTPPPANDGICGAIALTTGQTGTVSYINATNFASTSSVIPAMCAGGASVSDVWYSTIVPANGVVTASFSSSSSFTLTETVCAIYTSSDNTCSGTLTSAACNDDGGVGFLSFTQANGLTPGSTVFIRVSGYVGDIGTFGIALNNGMVWTGATSSDWSDNTNWASTPDASPTSSTSVNIPNTTVKPVVSSFAQTNSIAVQNGATITLSGNLNNLSVSGNLSTYGTGAPNYARVKSLVGTTPSVESQLQASGSTAQSIDGTWLVDNFTKNGASILTIQPTASLQVARLLRNSSTGSIKTNNKLVVRSIDGVLNVETFGTGQIVSGTGTYTDNVTIERKMGTTAYSAAHYVSSPISNANSVATNYGDDFSVVGAPADYFYTNNVNQQPSIWPNTWYYDVININPVTVANGGTQWRNGIGTNLMTAGRGLSITVQGNTRIDVDGTPQNADVTLTNTVLAPGNNLIGNPFPSTIDLNSFILNNSNLLYDAVYYFNNGNYVIYAGGAVQSPAIGAVQGSGLNARTIGNARYMGHSTGFWVVMDNTPTLSINNSWRNIDNGSGMFFNAEEPSLLRLQVRETAMQTNFDECVLGVKENAEDGLDKTDIGKLMMAGETHPYIYTIVDGTNTVFNYLAEGTEGKIIPIGVVAPTAGNWTIGLDNTSAEFVNAQSALMLEDRSTSPSTFYNLKANANVQFNLPEGNIGSRFFLHVGDTKASTVKAIAVANKEVSIYSNSNKLFVNFGAEAKGISTVEVFSLVGQRMVSLDATSYQGLREINMSNAAAGTYLVKVTNGDKVYTEKVFIDKK